MTNSMALQASPFFDKLVFAKIKARLGGRVRLIVTGGAPLANHVEEFLKVCFCCPVVQGFGLTETCAASCIAVPDVPVSKNCASMHPDRPLFPSSPNLLGSSTVLKLIAYLHCHA